MKKIIAAVTMACLALCYYNVEAAKKKNKNKTSATEQVSDQNKALTSVKQSKKNKKNKKKSKNKAKKIDASWNDSAADVKLDDSSKATYKEAAEKWVKDRGVQTDSEEESDDSETQTEEKKSKRSKKADAETQTKISKKEIKKKIEEVVGESEEKEAIVKVSQILNVPAEFLIIPKVTFGDEEEGMDKVHLIDPCENGQLSNNDLKVVFQGYKAKLKKILPIYVLPTTVDREMKKEYTDKAAELFEAERYSKDLKKYYMPTKEEILSRIENISTASDGDDEDDDED